jgi:hypothetical protein
MGGSVGGAMGGVHMLTAKLLLLTNRTASPRGSVLGSPLGVVGEDQRSRTGIKGRTSSKMSRSLSCLNVISYADWREVILSDPRLIRIFQLDLRNAATTAPSSPSAAAGYASTSGASSASSKNGFAGEGCDVYVGNAKQGGSGWGRKGPRNDDDRDKGMSWARWKYSSSFQTAPNDGTVRQEPGNGLNQPLMLGSGEDEGRRPRRRGCCSCFGTAEELPAM